MRFSFSSVQEVTDFFAGWHNYAETDRLTILRQLKEIGHVGVITTRQPKEHSLCPKYGFALIRPCGLRQCQFHAEAPETKNCLYNGLNLAKRNRLTTSEVATITRITQSEVNSTLQRAVLKIRRELLRDWLERHRVPRYYYIQGHCVGCEVSIQDDLEAGVDSSLLLEKYAGFGWCSPECKKAKPSWIFDLEHQYKCSFLDALAMAVLTLTMVDRKLTTSREIQMEAANTLEVDMNSIVPHWNSVLKHIESYS